MLEGFLCEERRQRVEVSRELRRQRADWDVWCLAFGVDYAQVVTPSLRQLRAQGDECAREENCHNILLSDFGLPFILAMWSGARLSQISRVRARGMLKALLERLVSSGLVTDAWAHSLRNDVSCACVAEAVDGQCSHLRSAFQLGGTCGTGFVAVVQALSSCAAEYLQCAACRAAVMRLVVRLCAHIRGRAEDLPCMDHNVLRHGVVQVGSSGRKRVDREFKAGASPQAAECVWEGCCCCGVA